MDQQQYQSWHIKRWLLEVISAAQRYKATDLVLAPAGHGAVSIRHRAEGVWREWSGTLWPLWPEIVPELAGLAGIREKPFPKAGIIYAGYSGLRVRWELHMTDPRTGCFLHNVRTELI